MSISTDELISRIEKDMEKFRLRKLDANGDFYDDDEDYNFLKETDPNEEHRLCRNELL